MNEALAFLGVCALVICTPGPDTALTIRNSIVGGRRGGVLTAAGIAAGQLVWTVAASIGIARLLQASQPAFLALKIVGAAYLVFLGVQSIVAAVRGRDSKAERDVRSTELGPWSAVRQGLISNLANPKMAVFFLSLLPQFVPGPSGSFAALIPLGLVFCLMTFGWLSIYAVALDRVAPFLQRSRVRRMLHAVTGTVLVAFGFRLATQTRCPRLPTQTAGGVTPGVHG
jgi:threonine/homoserine/homoserine lactone efflux protein